MNKQARKFFVGLVAFFSVFAILFSAGFVLANFVLITTSNPNTFGTTAYNVNESGVAFYFNVSINQTSTSTQGYNVTEINVTFPVGISLIASGNGTDARNVTFSVTGQTVTWRNVTGTVVYNVSRNFFWINGTPNSTTVGTYTVSVFTYNNTGVLLNHTNLSVVVNDTRKPEIQANNFSSTTSAHGGNYSGILKLNATITDNDPTKDNLVVFFNVTNGTAGNIVINGTGAGFLNSNGTFRAQRAGDTWFNSTALNTSNYPDGLYNITVYVNDSGNNRNSSANVQVRFDNTKPTVSISSSSATETTITFTATITDTSSISSSCSLVGNAGSVSGTGTSQTLTATGLACGTSYELGALCSDTAGNSQSATGTFSTSACSGGSGGSGGGGAGLSPSNTWKNTYVYDADEFRNLGQFRKSLVANSAVKIKVKGVKHTFGVRSVSASSAVVEVASDPQQKTMNVGDVERFDVDGDGYYDLRVTLVSVIPGTSADVSLEPINEQVVQEESAVAQQPSDSGSAVTGSSAARGSNAAIWAVVILVVIAAVVGFVMYSKRRK